MAYKEIKLLGWKKRHPLMMDISGFIFADIANQIQLQNQSQMLKLMEVWEYFPPTKEYMGKGTYCQGVKGSRMEMEV